MKFTLCLSTLGCPEASFDEAAALARAHGITRLELRCLGGEILQPENFPRHIPDVAAARSRLAAAGQQVHVLDTSVKLFEPTPDAVDNLVAFARLADALGASWLRLFDGGRVDAAPAAAEWAAAAALLAGWRDQRTRLGLRADVAIETHWALLQPAAAADFCGRLPGTALVWDAHHTWRTGGAGLTAYLAAVAPRVVHVHAKDSRPDATAAKGWSYCRPGTGDFPWTELRSCLAAINYSGAVAFEWEKYWHPGLAPLPEMLPAFVARMTR